jgi:hypothetical protein
MKTDRVCDECGCIHRDGISWHGRCYKCGGELIKINLKSLEVSAVTPKGIQIYQYKK